LWSHPLRDAFFRNKRYTKLAIGRFWHKSGSVRHAKVCQLTVLLTKHLPHCHPQPVGAPCHTYYLYKAKTVNGVQICFFSEKNFVVPKNFLTLVPLKISI
jgi:hypothetical protein